MGVGQVPPTASCGIQKGSKSRDQTRSLGSAPSVGAGTLRLLTFVCSGKAEISLAETGERIRTNYTASVARSSFYPSGDIRVPGVNAVFLGRSFM